MISNTVFKRSVLKNAKSKSLPSKRCVNISGEEASGFFTCVRTGSFAIFEAINELKTVNAKDIFVNIAIMLPEEYDEKNLKDLVKNLSLQCEKVNARIASICTDVSKAVNEFTVSVSAFGNSDKILPKANKNQDIVMVGCLGLSGTRKLIDQFRDKLIYKLNENTLDIAYGTEEELLIDGMLKGIFEKESAYVIPCEQGGVYAALWHLAEDNRVGFEIDFRKLCIRQEIIEVCEILDVNPYELSSLGCLLMTSSNGCGIVDMLQDYGYKACVIGTTTDKNAKELHFDDEVRFLDIPKVEELDRFM